MCGISFAFRPDFEPDSLNGVMKQSVAFLAHREPDSSGQ